MMSNYEGIALPLVSWVRLRAWLYRFLIFALFLTMRLLGPDALAVLRPIRVYLLDFFCSGIQYIYCSVLIFALSPYYILNFMFYGIS